MTQPKQHLRCEGYCSGGLWINLNFLELFKSTASTQHTFLYFPSNGNELLQLGSNLQFWDQQPNAKADQLPWQV